MAPSFDYTQSPQSERSLWINHWKASLSPEYIYDAENISTSLKRKRMSYVSTVLDENRHSSSNYKDLLDLTKNWARDFVQIIARIKQQGFIIMLTTDHGNVLATGWRSFTASEKTHLYGKMSRGHRSAIFMNETSALEFQQDLGYSVSTIHIDNWFVIRENQSFITEGKKEIAHGSSHLFEVMIPFIKFDMEQKTTIGLRQRIPMLLLEMALTAVLSGDYSREYFAELAATEYSGANRIGKTVTAISQLTDQNPLIDLLHENNEEVLQALRSKPDRTLILSSLIIAKFEFAYDLFTLLGKYFHVQDQVVTSLITQKMSQKYGSNRSLPNALYCPLPMFVEAGLLH